MRAAESPTAISISTALGNEVIGEWQTFTQHFIDRWLGWLDDPDLVPEELQPEQQRFDHQLRDHWYRLDPMNKHVVPAFGAEEVETMVNIRMGRRQMQEARRYMGAD